MLTPPEKVMSKYARQDILPGVPPQESPTGPNAAVMFIVPEQVHVLLSGSQSPVWPSVITPPGVELNVNAPEYSPIIPVPFSVR
jgi:hypothetical protein